MKSKTYFIPSIHCQHCIQTISTELTDLPGVQMVDGQLPPKQIIVSYEAPTTAAEIEKTLTDLGYAPHK